MSQQEKMMPSLSLYKCIGKGYERGWWTNCNARYRVYKGARNTKKSYDMIGYEVIDKIISDPRRNVMIIRDTFNTHRYSTFATLCKIIRQPIIDDDNLNLLDYFKINQQDMTITYKPTGQVILFRGFDSADKIASVRVVHGYLTDVYVEEAFEIKDYEKWRIADGSFRANKYFPDDLFIQITFCFNAWNQDHWLYEHFFKNRLEDNLEYLMTNEYMDYYDPNLIIDYGKGLYLHISTYKINEFRDTETYDVAMEEMRRLAPEIYKVEALGMWGNAGESTYPEFNDGLIVPPQYANNQRYNCYAIGLDTGLSNGEGHIKTGTDVRVRSATTMQLLGLTMDCEKVVCIDEFFYSNEQQMVKKTEPELMTECIKKIIQWKELYSMHPDLMKGIIMVYVDCADIGYRQGLELEARRQGLFNVKFMPSTKIRIQTRVDFIRLIMAYGEYLVCSNASNLIRETKNSRRGENGKAREDIDDHAINASEYSWVSFINKLKRWKQFKEH